MRIIRRNSAVLGGEDHAVDPVADEIASPNNEKDLANRRIEDARKPSPKALAHPVGRVRALKTTENRRL